MQILTAVLLGLLAVLERAPFWYCVTAIICTGMLGQSVLRGARYLAVAHVFGYRNSMRDLAKVRRDLIRSGAFGDLPHSDWLAKSAMIDRELQRLDAHDASLKDWPDEEDDEDIRQD